MVLFVVVVRLFSYSLPSQCHDLDDSSEKGPRVSATPLGWQPAPPRSTHWAFCEELAQSIMGECYVINCSHPFSDTAHKKYAHVHGKMSCYFKQWCGLHDKGDSDIYILSELLFFTVK